MLSTFHTIISLPFGLALYNPFLIFVCAFVAHLFSDTLLHWNIYPHHYKKYPFGLVALDVLGGIAISYALLGNYVLSISILAAIAGGNAPDVLHAFWSFLQEPTRKKAPAWIRHAFAFHEKIQRETESPSLGLISQIIVGGIAAILVLLWK